MATSTPIRIEEEIFAAAKAVAPTQDRSIAQQIAHWARIGRAVEASRSISVSAINDVLAGRRNYDTLASEEQAVVRAEWTRHIESLTRDGIDITQKFEAEGRSWVELGPEGELIYGGPGR